MDNIEICNKTTTLGKTSGFSSRYLANADETVALKG